MSLEPCITESELRNRKSQEGESSTGNNAIEEVLIEKLDKFLSSIESHLDCFEQYFKFNPERAEEERLNEELEGSSSRRRPSSASLSSLNSLKTSSIANLKLIYQRLIIMKDSVLKISITNLDKLYDTLDIQYKYLLNTRTEVLEDDGEDARGTLPEKIITTIQFLDDRLTQIDDIIQSKAPRATDDYESPIFKHIRFYNFNRALKKSQSGYLNYYDLPLSWRENRYIIFGYRFSLSNKSMLKSIFRFDHNESMNIWTHLVGLLVLTYISFCHYPYSEVYLKSSFRDKLVVIQFLVASIVCLVSSSIWHTYSCFAKYNIRFGCACIDYTGITILITSSVLTAEYCSLYHHNTMIKVFVIFSVICGMTGCIFNWSPHFDKPECRGLRIGFFMGLAFLGASAAFVKFFQEGFWTTFTFFIPMVYKSFLWYWIGVVFYGGLIPERWRYDVIVNEDDTCSHDFQSSDVLSANIENSGMEEMEEIKMDLKEEEEKQRSLATGSSRQADIDNSYNEIIQKHFPQEPTKSKYCNDFLSLWWVDYCFSSHSIWHIFVVLGVIGHYFSILEMFEKLL